MKKAPIWLMLLLLPMALYAMRPLDDLDLSNVSNPLSLSAIPDGMANKDYAAAKDGAAGCIMKFLQNSFSPGAYGDLRFRYPGADEEEPLSDMQPFPALYLMLTGEQYEPYSTNDYLKDQRALRENSAYASTDSPLAATPLEQQSSQKRSIEYPDGRTASSNDPIVVTTPLRTYYTNDTSSIIHHKSWVDIKAR